MQAPADDGHELTQLWKRYQVAADADQPLTQCKILEEIKQEAQKQHLMVDFYDAATLYAEVGTRRNWKQRDSLYKAMKAEIDAFGEPFLCYKRLVKYDYPSQAELWQYVKPNVDAMKGKRTPALWGDTRFIDENLKGFLADDAQYVLWDAFARRNINFSSSPEKDEVYLALKENLGSSYPLAPILEYAMASMNPDENAGIKALTEHASKYKGTAVSLFSRQALLRKDFYRLQKDNVNDENAYKDLLKECEAFEKDRARFHGDEAKVAKCCTQVEGIIDTLNDKDLTVVAGKGQIKVFFRNIAKASLEVTTQNGKATLYKTEVVNPARRFYLRDSVVTSVPSQEDGSFTVKVTSGDEYDACTYDQYRLSLATGRDADGVKFYVADYKSGEPLSRVTLILKKGDKVVATESVSLSKDGFTPLPSSMARTVKNHPMVWYELMAEAFDADRVAKRSMGLSLNYSSMENFVEDFSDDEDSGLRANIYKNQGAFQPGDTLLFKAVVFKGSLADKISVVSGKKVTAILFDTEFQEVGRLSLKTNAFGSVSGDFVLPKDRRGGMFCISLRSGNNTLESSYFRVDEYQLPSYELSFDSRDELYMPGQDITVSGKVKSYSGHPLSGAKLSASVKRYGITIFSCNPELDKDGNFSFTYKAKESGYNAVEVMVVDATGETLSFSTARYVSSSFSIRAVVNNAVDGSYELEKDNSYGYRPRYYGYYGGGSTRYIIEEDEIRFTGTVRNTDGVDVPMDYKWFLVGEKGDTLLKGSGFSGKPATIDASFLPAGLYCLNLRAKAGESETSSNHYMMKLGKGSKILPEGVRYAFLPGKTELENGQDISFRLGSSSGDIWAVAAVYGEAYKLLESRIVHVEKGSLNGVTLKFKDSYPDAVCVQLFFFMDGRQYVKNTEYRRKYDRLSMPLEFTSFRDMTRPGTEYTFSLKTAPGVEALAAVFDKSIDAIQMNEWVVLNPPVFHAYAPYPNAVCGYISDIDRYNRFYSMNSRAGSAVILNKTDLVEDDMVAMDYALPTPAQASTIEAAVAEDVSDEEAADDTAGVSLREMFATTLTFQPHLVSDASGNLSFSFRTSDKLSTYYVQVYAHDKKMKNALVRKETVVTIPVKVALVQPAFLYGGDSYTMSATVSSISDESVSGRLYLYAYPGEDYSGEALWIKRIPVEVAPRDVKDVKLSFDVPDDIDTLGLKLVFVADGFSDGMFVTVPVKKAAQTLTESHSAVYHPGASKNALIDRLRGLFVNADGTEAQLKEVSLLDMVKEAIPAKVEPKGNDVLSLTEALYVRQLAKGIGADFSDAATSSEEILTKILACRNVDGGFGWFEGMNSSPIVTAVVLERFAAIKDAPDMSVSVTYLDDAHFSKPVVWWRGCLSNAQYMYVRSLYASVPFEFKPEGKDQKKIMADFKKEAKGYLVPTGNRGLTGAILAKARRIRTLDNLGAGKEGIALAKAWGVTLATSSKLSKSLRADMVSLLEYAVEHRDGGWYYPNAVLPWRGLLETEAYAHAMICNVLSAYPDNADAVKVADGIRIWLMLQKESQKWTSDAGFVEALAAILAGDDKVLGTSVISLSATYTKPFAEIKAAGNGFTIERKFFREVNDKREEIKPGEMVYVGERIIAEYRVWNQENRSFVTLTASREASLRPENQLSGYYGWWNIRRTGAGFGYTPQGYRHVKGDVTLFFFDVFPEEYTTVQESFFVSQAGRFSAPVVSIESTYAPAYRANDAFKGALESSYR